MEKNIPTKTPPIKPKNNGPRKPALQLLKEFLKKNNLSFVVRRQEVRFLEDNGILIEPPTVVVMYADEFDRFNKSKNRQQSLTIKNQHG